MTELQRYLAEEVAEDHADGLVSRREALRRLGLLGLSSATAASLLAGIVASEAKARCVWRRRERRRRGRDRPRGRRARSCFAGHRAGSSWAPGQLQFVLGAACS